MGVSGFATFITSNSDLYLLDYKLCDSYLIVDGSCLASKIYCHLTERDSAFGGDYDEYYKIVYDFFMNLIKCKVFPIVLCDGRSETRKIPTKLNRCQDRINTLVNFYNYSQVKYFPIFFFDTFLSVLESLQVATIFCDFESDSEIAAIARDLNCPVLSYDSDFVFFGVKYIPIISALNQPQREEVFRNNYRYFIPCKIFNETNFLNHNGLDKSVLPLMASILGNDYVSKNAFSKFFNHVQLPNKRVSYNQKKIMGLIKWLSRETVESGIKTILSHVEKKNAEKLNTCIRMNMKHYCDLEVSESVTIQMLKYIRNYSPKYMKENPIHSELPLVILSKLRSFVLDIIYLKFCIVGAGVEDLSKEPIVKMNLDLIKKLFHLVTMIGKKSKRLKVVMRKGKSLIQLTLKCKEPEIHLLEVLKMPRDYRVKYLYELLNVNDDVQKIVSILGDDLALFVISLMHWKNVVGHSISMTHIHAIIIMIIANRIVQKQTGYFKNLSDYLKKNAKVVNLTNKSTSLSHDCEGESSFSEKLERVTSDECYRVQTYLIPLRQTIETGRNYSISVIHMFNCFQFILLLIGQINTLLHSPFPDVMYKDFYSGTLLFNLYVAIKKDSYVEKFGQKLFFSTPNLMVIYIFLSKTLCTYISENSTFGKTSEEWSDKKRKRGRKKRSKEEKEQTDNSESENEIDINFDTLEDFTFIDKNNPYSVLGVT